MRWGWPASLSLPPADSPTVRALSRWSSGHGDYHHDRLARFQLLFLHLLIKQFGHPPGWLLWALQILVKSGMNHFSQHIMGLSDFPDTLPPCILHFGSNISDGSLCVELALICYRQFHLLHLLLISVFSLRCCQVSQCISTISPTIPFGRCALIEKKSYYLVCRHMVPLVFRAYV